MQTFKSNSKFNVQWKNIYSLLQERIKLISNTKYFISRVLKCLYFHYVHCFLYNVLFSIEIKSYVLEDECLCWRDYIKKQKLHKGRKNNTISNKLFWATVLEKRYIPFIIFDCCKKEYFYIVHKDKLLSPMITIEYILLV